MIIECGENEVPLFGHKIIICSACPVLGEMLDKKREISRPFFSLSFDEKNNRQILKCIPGVARVIMQRILLFLYSGKCDLKNKNDLVAETMEMSEFLELDYLRQICENFLSDFAELNPSIQTFLTDQTAERLRKKYWLQSGDITFRVPENPEDENSGASGIRRFPAHKIIVTARCEALRGMLTNDLFLESRQTEPEISNTTANAFEAFLFFLYTEHTVDGFDFSENLVEVLQLANYYNCARLISLTELYLSKFIERSTADNIVKNESVELVELLNLASRIQAPQLMAFLRHFFCVNFFAVSQRPDFGDLEKENKEFVEKNKWPPESYFDEVKRYEKEHSAWEKRKGKKEKSGDGFFSRLFASVSPAAKASQH